MKAARRRIFLLATIIVLGGRGEGAAWASSGLADYVKGLFNHSSPGPETRQKLRKDFQKGIQESTQQKLRQLNQTSKQRSSLAKQPNQQRAPAGQTSASEAKPEMKMKGSMKGRQQPSLSKDVEPIDGDRFRPSVNFQSPDSGKPSND